MSVVMFLSYCSFLVLKATTNTWKINKYVYIRVEQTEELKNSHRVCVPERVCVYVKIFKLQTLEQKYKYYLRQFTDMILFSQNGHKLQQNKTKQKKEVNWYHVHIYKAARLNSFKLILDLYKLFRSFVNRI